MREVITVSLNGGKKEALETSCGRVPDAFSKSCGDKVGEETGKVKETVDKGEAGSSYRSALIDRIYRAP
jgi:hypothetical protein